MFIWLNKQGVKSEKGFVVQVISRFVIEYREGFKVISIEVEPGFLSNEKVCISIKASAFDKWDAGTPIPVEKQTEIIRNFKDAMKFQGVEVIVD